MVFDSGKLVFSFFTVKTVILFAIYEPIKLQGNSITKTLSRVSLEVYLSHVMISRVVEEFEIVDQSITGISLTV